jgi:hypothetical protein
MELVVDVYNKLHSRDELFFCPSCRRILYIPEDLPPETAVHKKKPSKPKKAPGVGAAPRRGEAAVDVMNSVNSEDESAESGESPENAESTERSPTLSSGSDQTPSTSAAHEGGA